MTDEVIGTIPPQPPAGTYRIVVQAVETVQDEQTGDSYRRWQLKDRKSPYVFRATSSMAIGPSSKTFEWCMALLQCDPSGLPFPGAIIGRWGMIQVVHNDQGYAKVANVHPDPDQEPYQAASLQHGVIAEAGLPQPDPE